MLNPVPAVLVSCGQGERANLITVAWTGTICTDPPMLYISVRPERYSHAILMDEMEFTVNLTTEEMAQATDWCGVRSGRDYNKWAETGLNPYPGVAVKCPAVEQSPLCIECKTKEVLHLGSHDMFVAQVVNVLADDRFINPETGAFDLAAAGLIAYAHGKYFAMGEYLGHFGFSIRKKK